MLYQPSTEITNQESFRCTAADPAGGFCFLVTSGLGPRLYHSASGAGSASTLARVVTEPSLGEARVSHGGLNAIFSNCAMTVAPDGTIYISTEHQVWRVAP